MGPREVETGAAGGAAGERHLEQKSCFGVVREAYHW